MQKYICMYTNAYSEPTHALHCPGFTLSWQRVLSVFAPTLNPLCHPAQVTFPVSKIHAALIQSVAEVNQT